MMMFNKNNRILAGLICLCLLLTQISAMADETTLPAVGAPTGTVAADEATGENLPEDETEVSATEDSSNPQGETEPEIDPSLAQVSQYLELKEQQSTEQVVNVTNEHTDGQNSSGGNYEAMLLKNLRLRKQAELSEMNMIVYRSSGFVNVRKAPNTDGDVVGKMRNETTAQVLESLYQEDGLWYHIRSGEVEGYVKAEFFESGAAAADIISTIVRCYASVNNDAQRLYRGESTDSDTLAVLYSGQKYQVESRNDYFVKILYASGERGTIYGYVPRDSVSLSWETGTAYTLEAERMELEESNRIMYEMSKADKSREESRIASVSAAEESSIRASIEASIAASIKAEDDSRRASQEAAYQASLEESRRQSEAAAAVAESIRRAEEASRQAAESASREAQQSHNVDDYSSYIPAGTSDLRRRIVTNALQYVNVLDYIWGGYSLSSGTDCSGFVSLIYAQYGISLAHYSYHIAYTGVKVMSIDQARPGDIVCWRTWDAGAGQGHVAIYIGRNPYGQPCIVEAPREGLKVRVIVMPTDGLHTIQNVIGD